MAMSVYDVFKDDSIDKYERPRVIKGGGVSKVFAAARGGGDLPVSGGGELMRGGAGGGEIIFVERVGCPKWCTVGHLN